MTINWVVPRLIPGDPIKSMLSKFKGSEEVRKNVYEYYLKSYGMDKPLWQQYLTFWLNLFKGDFGTSLYYRPKKAFDVLAQGIPYTLLIVIPALAASWIAGNMFGAFAARRKFFDSIGLPSMYVLTAIPFMWLGIVLAWLFGFVLNVFPLGFPYSTSIMPSPTVSFVLDFLWHWILPFMTLFIVWIGGWAIGMRNMIIYELEANYSRYMECLGAPNKLIRKYAFRNAVLPQVTGLGIQLGMVLAGNIVIEIVFSYPGVGHRILQAVKAGDFFVVQGGFVFLILGVLIANFIIDFIYVFIDPRIRYAYDGGK